MTKSIYRAEYTVLLRQLRDHRELQGVSQVELARRLGTRQSYVSDIERGSRRLDVIELRDMCMALGVGFQRFCTELEWALAELRTGKRPQ